MESLLVKIFATALALSQVTTTPDAVKTEFSRDRDQAQVARLLHAGCTHMLKAFDLESINIDDLIATALDDPQAIGESKAFRGINFADLQTAYRQFCKSETVPKPAVDLGDVIDFYNKAAANLPDHGKLKGLKLPGASIVLDRKGERFAEVFEENQRRVWVPLADIPEQVRNAFIAAEDKRFYQHKGIDERGLIRAFIGNLAQSGRPQGGSTITQQIVKNLLVGEDLTYERKIREMIITARVEASLSKDEILELYLNSIYLGRSSWGIELAARSYFGKPTKELTLEQGALLAGLTKGPNYFSPDRQPGRAQERLAYVLSRMREDGMLGAQAANEEASRALPTLPTMVAYERPRRDIGFHFVDQVAREAKAVAGIDAITANSYTVRSTIVPSLQRAVEESLQEGLWRYERSAGRVQFRGAEANLAQAVQKIEANKKSVDKRPVWQQALANARLPLYDVHWTPALVLDKPGGGGGGSGSGRKGDAGGGNWRVGLSDGRIVPLSLDNANAQRMLKLYDVVLVRVVESRGGEGKGGKTAAARAELRVRPVVQGTVVVLENKTGRILAMSGGFSYPLSQLNRATQAVRQPGSAIKPLSYLAALGKGLQPNTLISDDSITLPPIGGGRAREQDYWTPKNYDGGGGGALTLRRALENSRNLATVHLLDGGIEDTPEASLDRLCKLAVEAQIYRECLRYYPFVLGAQPVRPVDLAAFYAAIANEGLRPAPYVIDSIERNGLIVYRHDPKASTMISSVDRTAFYQLKTLMQGVVARGTARAISVFSPYVAGKTGTSDEENDAWFVGFSNDVTIAVWIGYDNASGKRRTLGGGSTGGGVAVPIFEPIMQAAWANVAPKAALAPPSPEARRHLACRSADADPGDVQARGERPGGGRGGATECFRIDGSGQVVDTQYSLVSRGDYYEDDRQSSGGYYTVNPNPFGFFRRPDNGGGYEQRRDGYYYYGNNGRTVPAPRDSWQQQPPAQSYGQTYRDPRVPRDPYGRTYQTPQRVDPGYIWGGGRY
jgi:penicillin-binding protein 1A